MLKRLWLGFCCPYRNKLAHGGTHEFGIADQAAPLLLHVNHCFVKELDSRVQMQYKRDPLGHLKHWKLPKGAEAKDDTILGELEFPNSRSPMSVVEVRRELENTRHQAP